MPQLILMILNQRIARMARLSMTFTAGLGLGGGTSSSTNYVSTSSGSLLTDVNGNLISLK